MNHGTKISKNGYNVEGKKSKKKATSNTTLPHMISSLAIPFLVGARAQVARYQEAAKHKEESGIYYVMVCLHEASSLFENLDAVDRYTQMCGKKHLLHQNILDIRNHIRHDLRDNLDHESNKGRQDRIRKLGINPKLLVSIGFDNNSIKVGKVKVTMDEIVKFLDWAEGVFGRIIEDAAKKGLIEGISYDRDAKS